MYPNRAIRQPTVYKFDDPRLPAYVRARCRTITRDVSHACRRTRDDTSSVETILAALQKLGNDLVSLAQRIDNLEAARNGVNGNGNNNDLDQQLAAAERTRADISKQMRIDKIAKLATEHEVGRAEELQRQGMMPTPTRQQYLQKQLDYRERNLMRDMKSQIARGLQAQGRLDQAVGSSALSRMSGTPPLNYENLEENTRGAPEIEPSSDQATGAGAAARMAGVPPRPHSTKLNAGSAVSGQMSALLSDRPRRSRLSKSSNSGSTRGSWRSRRNRASPRQSAMRFPIGKG